ncbi:MAG: hypothetical protein UIJ87_02545 [Anaerovoracaceae bacterium]|nr:hypothetical protein [Anaerovoracaceae bacterium]
MKKTCTICGCSYGDLYAFKAGHICENCVRLLKACNKSDAHVRVGEQL